MIIYKHVIPSWQGTYQIIFIHKILDIITSTPFQEYSHHKFVLLDSFRNSINRHQILFQKKMRGILNFKFSCIGYSYCFHISSQIFFIPFDFNIQSSCIQAFSCPMTHLHTSILCCLVISINPTYLFRQLVHLVLTNFLYNLRLSLIFVSYLYLLLGYRSMVLE